jgi:hypothetical protein
MFKFSAKLIEQCKLHYAQKYHVELTSDQAEVFLSSLADLYLLVVGIQPNLETDEAGADLPSGQRGPAEPAAAGAPVILDPLHT